MILGKSYHDEDAEEFPPKKLIPYLVPYLIPITFMDIGANRETIEESLKQFKKKMDEDPNCDIKELIDSYQKNSSYRKLGRRTIPTPFYGVQTYFSVGIDVNKMKLK